jgi:hypothetical protein
MAERGVAHKEYVWDKQAGVEHWCNIHVQFMGGTEYQRAMVAQIVTGPEGWNRASGAQFVFQDMPNSPVRIAFEPGASWSHPGNYGVYGPFDRPTMNFGWLYEGTSLDEWRRVVLHEMGHALALQHEHEHPWAAIPWNLATIYDYYWQTSGWTPDVVDAQVLTPLAEEMALTTTYNPDSIMSYAIAPEVVTDPTWAHEQKTHISAGDVRMVQMLYGLPPALTEHQYLPAVRA